MNISPAATLRWLNTTSHGVRGIFAALIAIVLTGGATALLYGTLYRLDTAQLSFFDGAINVNNIVTLSFVVLALIGIFFYVIGWSVLIGFGGESFQIGYAGLLWLYAGLFVTVVLIGAGINAVSVALQQT